MAAGTTTLFLHGCLPPYRLFSNSSAGYFNSIGPGMFVKKKLRPKTVQKTDYMVVARSAYTVSC